MKPPPPVFRVSGMDTGLIHYCADCRCDFCHILGPSESEAAETSDIEARDQMRTKSHDYLSNKQQIR